MIVSTPTSLHSQLREATKSSHHVLDHHPKLSPLLRPELTPSQYGDALAGLYGIHASLESKTAAFLERQPLPFDYARRRRLAVLRQDLEQIGRHPPAQLMPFPDPQTPAELVGILYTLEGSTKGGRYIAEAIAKHTSPPLPVRFFSGYGAETDAMWQEFWTFAEAMVPPHEAPAAAATAVALFGAIKNYLDSTDTNPRSF